MTTSPGNSEHTPHNRSVTSNIASLTTDTQGSITECQKVEEEKNIFLTLSVDMAGIIGMDGYFKEINPAVEKILGYTPAEFLSKPFFEFVHPDDKAATLAVMEKFKEGSSKISVTNRYKCKDGSYKWLEWNTTAVGENIYTVAKDVTERKKFEEALLISENQFKGAFRHSAIGMSLVSPEGNLKEVNDQFCDIVGYTRAELLQRRFQDITHPDDIELGLKNVQELIEGKAQSFTLEKRYIHKNGSIVWVLLVVSKITDNNGNIVHFVAQTQDITESKKSNQQIREQAALLDIVPDAIFMRDLNDKYIFWNKGAERMYGYTAEEIIGTTYMALRGKDTLVEYNKAKKTLLDTGEWSGELWLKDKAGKPILVQSRWTLVRDAKGGPSAVLATNTDITEKRSLEKQLLRSQRLESIGTLASGIAHDLNNLLTPVVLGMELLKMQLHDEQSRQRINSLVSAVQRGSGLIHQLLSFAKGKDGNHETLNVKYIIDEAVKFVRETFPRNIEVQVNIAKEDLMITGDATQVNQIIMNLLINSRDAMEDRGGILSIEATRITADELLLRRYMDAVPGQYVAITVSDTGTGISHELQEKVFEPFFTTKDIGKGTGIGLTTVFSIVRSHKGFITLYSDVGKGSSFTVYLPFSEEIETVVPQEIPVVKSKSEKNECILLVDDEEFIRTIAGDTLTNVGYRVITAANGEEALESYRRHLTNIALVLTDVMMPVMDGIELAGELRKLDPAIKIIAASGLMNGKTAARLKTVGVTAMLSKPYTAGTLLHTVGEVLAE
jgi:PAS domain S-box-containing protein